MYIFWDVQGRYLYANVSFVADHIYLLTFYVVYCQTILDMMFYM